MPSAKSLAINAKVGSRKEELKRIRKPGSQEELTGLEI
jgi:hypothetical protein